MKALATFARDPIVRRDIVTVQTTTGIFNRRYLHTITAM